MRSRRRRVEKEEGMKHEKDTNEPRKTNHPDIEITSYTHALISRERGAQSAEIRHDSCVDVWTMFVFLGGCGVYADRKQQYSSSVVVVSLECWFISFYCFYSAVETKWHDDSHIVS